MAWWNMEHKITQTDIGSLTILRYPDPRLREVCTEVEEFDAELRAMVERMFELMFAVKGVGLAANQVGASVRVFVASPTQDPADRRVFVNPRIVAAEGTVEDEEGCLSFPDITCTIKRSKAVTVEATDLERRVFQEVAQGLRARIIQHEIDHLDGTLIVDRMGSVARLAHRRALKNLEDDFESPKR
jgi:peptide deformylase